MKKTCNSWHERSGKKWKSVEIFFREEVVELMGEMMVEMRGRKTEKCVGLLGNVWRKVWERIGLGILDIFEVASVGCDNFRPNFQNYFSK